MSITSTAAPNGAQALVGGDVSYFVLRALQDELRSLSERVAEKQQQLQDLRADYEKAEAGGVSREKLDKLKADFEDLEDSLNSLLEKCESVKEKIMRVEQKIWRDRMREGLNGEDELTEVEDLVVALCNMQRETKSMVLACQGLRPARQADEDIRCDELAAERNAKMVREEVRDDGLYHGAEPVLQGGDVERCPFVDGREDEKL